ncbi:MAG: preprotein translocase subunit SecE [Acidobacteriota bacterium]|nr:preprotein translocase subunit SecE [Acidobacteriota bacterium]
MSWIEKSKTFISETISETKKANFPTRDELVSLTAVVLVTSVIFAAFLWIADQGITWFMLEVLGR